MVTHETKSGTFLTKQRNHEKIKNKHEILHGFSILLSNYQGPVVQSVVSLTSSLRVISLTVLADSIHNILIFFAEKM